MRLSRSVLIILLLVLLPACNLPGVTTIPLAPVPPGTSLAYLVGVPAGATPTPTPFQPLPPTPTYFPTDLPVPTEIPPTETPPEPEPEPETEEFPGAEDLPQATGRVNILLLGTDQRPGDYGFRTDTIVLLTINADRGSVSLTSFPRDLYVYIPGWMEQRINTAFGYGGFGTLAATFEQNFGIRPDGFVLVHLFAFVEVIDSLDGIDVKVAQELKDHRDGYGNYHVDAGVNHMDGETALWYVRSRYTSNDFDRTRRQQEVIKGIFDRLISLDGIRRAPELYEIYKQNVTTNLTFEDLAPLLPLAAKVHRDAQVYHYFIGPGEVYPWVTPGGAQVLLPNQAAIQNVLQQALNSP